MAQRRPERGEAEHRGAAVAHASEAIRPVSLLRLSLLRFVDSKFPGNEFPVGARITPLKLKLLLESNPLKSRILARRLDVSLLSFMVSWLFSF